MRRSAAGCACIVRAPAPDSGWPCRTASSSSAIRIVSAGYSRGAASTPVSFCSTRRPTSRRSLARAASSSFLRAASRSACCVKAACHPNAALLPCSMARVSDGQQIRIVQQLTVRGEDRRLGTGSFALEPRLQRIEVRLCPIERRVERLPLHPRVVCVFNDPKLLMPHQKRLADSDPRRGGDASQHVRVLVACAGERESATVLVHRTGGGGRSFAESVTYQLCQRVNGLARLPRRWPRSRSRLRERSRAP